MGPHPGTPPEGVVFVDEWGDRNLRQLGVLGPVFMAMGAVFLALGTQLPGGTPAIAALGLAVLGIATLSLGSVSLSFARTRHRFPFMVANHGLYLPDQVPKSSPKTHGVLVSWEAVRELVTTELTPRGSAIRVYDLTVVTHSGERKGGLVATHSDLTEVLGRFRPLRRESAGARI